MIHNVPAPEISLNFTIDDIRKLREWDYERLKDATREEIRDDTARRTAEALKKLGLEGHL
ncbi:MAG: hypothetical protein LBS35_13930 [Synergistaceae bacterium]|jgi:hypothetical protein|nr:hypothetical protein [Synergistaceae bacterium]